jgi:hypothetical protein
VPKLNTPETVVSLVILGGIAGWFAFSDPSNQLLTLIVGGLMLATNLSPPNKGTPL